MANVISDTNGIVTDKSVGSSGGALPPYFKEAIYAAGKLGWNPLVVYGQWAHETGHFTSGVFKYDNNFAGLTYYKNSNPLLQKRGSGRPSGEGGAYFKFDTQAQGVDGYVAFLTAGSRYANVKNETTIAGQVRAIAKAGYATDSSYYSKVMSIISDYQKKYPAMNNYGSIAGSNGGTRSPYLTNLPAMATNNIKRTYASDYAYEQALKLGLKLTSAYRDPNHAESKANPKSDHIKGQAYDFAGSRDAMMSLAKLLNDTGMYKQIIFDNKDWKTGNFIADHQDHVHVAFYDYEVGGTSLSGLTDGVQSLFANILDIFSFNGTSKKDYDEVDAGAFSVFDQIEELTEFKTINSWDALKSPFEYIEGQGKAFVLRALIVIVGLIIFVFGAKQIAMATLDKVDDAKDKAIETVL